MAVPKYRQNVAYAGMTMIPEFSRLIYTKYFTKHYTIVVNFYESVVTVPDIYILRDLGDFQQHCQAE